LSAPDFRRLRARIGSSVWLRHPPVRKLVQSIKAGRATGSPSQETRRSPSAPPWISLWLFRPSSSSQPPMVSN